LATFKAVKHRRFVGRNPVDLVIKPRLLCHEQVQIEIGAVPALNDEVRNQGKINAAGKRADINHYVGICGEIPSVKGCDSPAPADCRDSIGYDFYFGERRSGKNRRQPRLSLISPGSQYGLVHKPLLEKNTASTRQTLHVAIRFAPSIARGSKPAPATKRILRTSLSR